MQQQQWEEEPWSGWLWSSDEKAPEGEGAVRVRRGLRPLGVMGISVVGARRIKTQTSSSLFRSRTTGGGKASTALDRTA